MVQQMFNGLMALDVYHMQQSHSLLLITLVSQVQCIPFAYCISFNNQFRITQFFSEWKWEIFEITTNKKHTHTHSNEGPPWTIWTAIQLSSKYKSS